MTSRANRPKLIPMKHPPFDIDDTDNLRLAVFLRNGEEYIGGRPFGDQDTPLQIVAFWFENELVAIPLDLVKKVVVYTIKGEPTP